jgi:hydrogenase maturation protease
VRVLDGGVLGVTALGLFEGCREAFVVDAVEDDAPPGTVVRFPLERAGRRRPPRTSHAATVDELVDLLPIVLGDRAPPPITVYGVVVDRGAVRPGLELSAAVDAGVVEVCARLAVELAERTARRVRRAW